jgi:hypothetical protein
MTRIYLCHFATYDSNSHHLPLTQLFHWFALAHIGWFEWLIFEMMLSSILFTRSNSRTYIIYQYKDINPENKL